MIDGLLFSEDLKQAVSIAQSIAKEYRNEHFSGLHLLKALLHDDIGLKPLIESLGKDIYYLRDWADFGIENYPKSTKTIENPTGDESITRIFNHADLIRLKLSKDIVDPLSTFLAILKPGIAFAAEKLKTLPISHDEVMKAIIDKFSIEKAITSSTRSATIPKNAILK